MRVTRDVFAWAAFACLFSALASAQEAEPTKVSASQVVDSPTFQQNQNEILARAHEIVAEQDAVDPDLRRAIQGKLDALPYTQLVDLEFAFFTGYPDLFAACVEGHPKGGLAIEACASAAVFITSLQASVSYRWDV